MARRISRKGAEFVSRWEGFSAAPYNDAANHCTRGYGELLHYGPCDGDEKATTERAARRKLRRTLNRYARDVRRLIGPRLNRHQLDALTSFAYNVGVGALEGSTLRKRLNAGESRWHVIREELPKWSYAGGQKLEGLAKRRRAEINVARGDYSGRP